MCIIVDRSKAVAGDIHVRTKNRNAHGFAFPNEVSDFFRISEVVGKHGSHELDRVVGLEVGGAVTHHRIRGGVGFVESVGREAFENREDFQRRRAAHAMLLAGTFHKYFFLRRHFLGFLFPHRPAEDVGIPERVSRNDLSRLHDLFLIHQHAICLLDEIGQKRVGNLNRGWILLSLDELGNELHRTGPVERDQGDDFLEA
ncbi:MAG: hypothetical protein BWY82_01256 [Verrucomicrobia bacterium ADurb.Bin474]|nr:MAG: hypothetical protein BWY82_01256 [Verrucomicrobia bacterium ADurb.Bin474]